MTNQLKTEIEKINQGCGKRFEISENRLAICGKYYYDEKEQTLCPSCQAERQGIWNTTTGMRGQNEN
jgi:hypothetical protein